MVKKPPSRVRYERSHPVISARVDRDTYDKLRKIVESEGKSLAGFLKDFVRNKKDKWDGAYDRGYRTGREYCQVWYYCDVCGEKMFVWPDSPEHDDIIKYMKERRWGHAECHRQNR